VNVLKKDLTEFRELNELSKLLGGKVHKVAPSKLLPFLNSFGDFCQVDDPSKVLISFLGICLGTAKLS
jgi:hypothetical protein